MKVAHFIDPWLPVTQNWIYNQLHFNTQCEHIVLCRTLENVNQFPFKNLFPAFTQRNLLSSFSMIKARFLAQYPTGYFNSIVKKQKPDLFHGHFSWESWRNINLVRKTGLPLITTFYGLDINKLPRRKAWRRRYPVLFKEGSLFIVEGHYMAKRLENLGCPSEKIRVVHLGVDIDKIGQLRDNRENQDKVNLLFIGLEREKKGGIFTAEAFCSVAKSFDKVHLHIIGSGFYREKVEQILRDGNAIDKVTFHGYVPVSVYHKLLAQTDILLAPSVTGSDGDTEGGAPVSVIEAQAAGIPVIGTFHCDIPNIVENGVTGLLSPERDSAHLSENLLKLVSDTTLRENMGVEAKSHVRKNHNIYKQAEKLYHIYQSVLRSN